MLPETLGIQTVWVMSIILRVVAEWVEVMAVAEEWGVAEVWVTEVVEAWATEDVVAWVMSRFTEQHPEESPSRLSLYVSSVQ